MTDEAKAVLDILAAEERGLPVPQELWAALFGSEGYRRLRARELAMGVPFTDSAFTQFVRSDSLVPRRSALTRAVFDRETVDARAAAAQALSYLPGGARITARVYLEIKPRTNSFVFGAEDSLGVFMYVDPGQSAANYYNFLTHELHHVGFATICPSVPHTVPEPQRTLLVRLGAFGEGFAMLAAAGSPEAHPHATSPLSKRERWDRDVAGVDSAFRQLEAFMRDVLTGRVSSADSVKARAFLFYGEQGPWYTVGWLMAATIEREAGRGALVRVICDPVATMQLYNDLGRTGGRHSDYAHPLWSSDVIQDLARLRAAP